MFRAGNDAAMPIFSPPCGHFHDARFRLLFASPGTFVMMRLFISGDDASRALLDGQPAQPALYGIEVAVSRAAADRSAEIDQSAALLHDGRSLPRKAIAGADYISFSLASRLCRYTRSARWYGAVDRTVSIFRYRLFCARRDVPLLLKRACLHGGTSSESAQFGILSRFPDFRRAALVD